MAYPPVLTYALRTYCIRISGAACVSQTSLYAKKTLDATSYLGVPCSFCRHMTLPSSPQDTTYIYVNRERAVGWPWPINSCPSGVVPLRTAQPAAARIAATISTGALAGNRGCAFRHRPQIDSQIVVNPVRTFAYCTTPSSSTSAICMLLALSESRTVGKRA